MKMKKGNKIICNQQIDTIQRYNGEFRNEKTQEENNEMDISEKYLRHNEICQKLNETYELKNTAYDDAFGKTFQELGIISAVTRMSDKWNRIKALTIGVENNVKDEALEDTLMDMANYCIMTLIEMENK